MSIYNTLHASATCPRCGASAETAIDCYFGYTGEMADLNMGDRYPWAAGEQPQNGGRPEGGSIDGEGYMECPHCHKDAFLRVIVRNDVIVEVEPDATKPGYILD